MYNIPLLFALFKEKFHNLIDKIDLGIYGANYQLCPPYHDEIVNLPNTINIYRPLTEANGIAVRLVFSHRGQIEKIINCHFNLFTMLDLPWGGTLFCDLTAEGKHGFTEEYIRKLSIGSGLTDQDIMIGTDPQDTMCIIIGGRAHKLD